MKKPLPPDDTAIRRRVAIAAGLTAPLLVQPATAQQPASPREPAVPDPVEQIVESMTELKRLTHRPALVLLTGYRSIADHGGGLFVWLEGDTTPADHGLIVQPDGGPPGRYRRLYDGHVQAAWFGTVGDGVANDTQALQRFLNAVSAGKVGNWAGTYAIDEGVLVIEPPPGASVVAPGSLDYFRSPCLIGDVTFVGRGTGTGPFLSVRNPPQNSGGGDLLAGGTLGNLTFIDKTCSTLTSRHGLFAQGLFNWTIGSLSGFGLGGSVYSTSRQTVMVDGAPDPDPYDNTVNRIGSVLAVNCNAVAYDGDAFTEDGNRINFIGAYGEPAPGVTPLENGIMRNSGQGTELHACSSIGTRGWALKFGGPATTGNRQLTFSTEIVSEYGIWVATLEQFEITGRIIIAPFHGEAWPRTILKLGGIGRAVSNGRITLILRIDRGITLSMLGTLFDFSNDPNIRDVEVDLIVHDESNTGLLDRRGNLTGGMASIAANLHPVAGITLKISGTAVLSQNRTTAVRVRLHPGTGVLPSARFGSPESRLRGRWTPAGDDGLGILDAEQHCLRIVAQGRYRVHCHLCLPVGTAEGKIAPQSLIRYGLLVEDGQHKLDGLVEGACVVQDAGGVHQITMDVAAAPLRAGQRLWISLEVKGQNGPCKLHGLQFLNAANIFELSLLSPD